VRVSSPKKIWSTTRDVSLSTVEVLEKQQPINMNSTLNIHLVHEKFCKNKKLKDISSYFGA